LEYLPIPFFTAFWFLTLDSVYFPAKSYTEKIDDLKVSSPLFRKKSSQAKKEIVAREIKDSYRECEHFMIS
jgi:hypothetical protein